MDLDLVGYLFGLLEPSDRERTEAAIRADPAARTCLERLRTRLAPLVAARRDEAAPAGLADRTIDRLSPYFRNHRPAPARRSMPADSEPVFAPSRWRRMDIAVAAAILIVVGGLGTSGAGRLQQRHDPAACQNNLRQPHQALDAYSVNHDGRFPQVTDQPPNNVAAAFVPMLQNAGQLPATGVPACPAVVVAPGGAGGYAYTLGFRGPDGQLHGLRHGHGLDADLLPLLADRPVPAGHRTGHNVL